MSRTFSTLILAMMVGVSLGQSQPSPSPINNDTRKKSADTTIPSNREITVTLDTATSASILALIEEMKKSRESQKPEEYEGKSPYKIKGFWYRFGVDDWTITALTLFILLAVWKQIKWMRDTVKVMESTVNVMKADAIQSKGHTQQELRAYVHVKIGDVAGVEELNGWMDGHGTDHPNNVFVERVGNHVWIHNPPRVRYPVIVENHGQTPAYSVTVQVSVMHDAWPFPLREEIRTIPTFGEVQQFMHDARISSTLPPNKGAEVTAWGLLEDVVWTQSKVAPLRAFHGVEPTAAIYIFGFVGYVDAFGKPRVTQFRFAHTTGEEGIFDAKEVTQHPDGNDAT